MSEHDRVETLVEALTNCLAQLDELKAHVAGAYVDSALQALRRQFETACELSDME